MSNGREDPRKRRARERSVLQSLVQAFNAFLGPQDGRSTERGLDVPGPETLTAELENAPFDVQAGFLTNPPRTGPVLDIFNAPEFQGNAPFRNGNDIGSLTIEKGADPFSALQTRASGQAVFGASPQQANPSLVPGVEGRREDGFPEVGRLATTRPQDDPRFGLPFTPVSESNLVLRALEDFSGQSGPGEQAVAAFSEDSGGFLSDITDAFGLTGDPTGTKFPLLMSQLSQAIAGPHQNIFGAQLGRALEESVRGKQFAQLLSDLESGTPPHEALAKRGRELIDIQTQQAALDQYLKTKASEQAEREVTVQEGRLGVDQALVGLREEALELRETLGLKNISVQALSAYLSYLGMVQSGMLRAGAGGGRGGEVDTAKTRLSLQLLAATYGDYLQGVDIKTLLDPTTGAIDPSRVLHALPNDLHGIFTQDMAIISDALANDPQENVGKAMIQTVFRPGSLGNPIVPESPDQVRGFPTGTVWVHPGDDVIPAGTLFFTDANGQPQRVPTSDTRN